MVEREAIDVLICNHDIGLSNDIFVKRLTAIAFSLKTGKIFDTFDRYLKIENVEKSGLKNPFYDNRSTPWYTEPSKIYQDVFEKVVRSDVDLEFCLFKFDKWLESLVPRFANDKYNTRVCIWKNHTLSTSCNFSTWLCAAYKHCNIEFTYYKEYDAETLIYLSVGGFNLRKFNLNHDDKEIGLL